MDAIEDHGRAAWLRAAMRPSVVRRSLNYALVVMDALLVKVAGSNVVCA